MPLVLRLPDGGGAGRRVTTPVCARRRRADAARDRRAPAPALVGRNLLVPGEEGAAVSELLYRYGEARTLVRDMRKLVVKHEGERRETGVFDLNADPGEHDPLPVDAALATALDERVQAEMRARSAATEAPVDEETRRRLRAVGYAK